MLLLFGNYYRKLFSSDQDSFKREEIIDYKNIFYRELASVMPGLSTDLFISAGIGFGASYLFSHIGHIYGYYYESYFFNSCIYALSVSLALLPYVRSDTPELLKKLYFTSIIIDKPMAFILGTCIASMGQLLAVYRHHEINFAWLLLNYSILLVFLFYKLYFRDKSTENEDDSLEKPILE